MTHETPTTSTATTTIATCKNACDSTWIDTVAAATLAILVVVRDFEYGPTTYRTYHSLGEGRPC
jgi:hypothetical protein